MLKQRLHVRLQDGVAMRRRLIDEIDVSGKS
jgi:hypothetical protein